MNKRQTVLMFVVVVGLLSNLFSCGSKGQDKKPNAVYTTPATKINPVTIPPKKFEPIVLFPDYSKIPYDREISSIPTKCKVIFLTFDDTGNREQVTAILKTLKKARAHGTFFLNGNFVGYAPDLVKRIVREGNVVGNHTVSHLWWTDRNFNTRLSKKTMRREVMGLEKQLKVLGINPKPWFRFPGMFRNRELVRLLASWGYRSFLWTYDSRGIYGASPNTILRNFKPYMRPGSIVLLHLHSWNDIRATSLILEYAAAHGYTFKTL